MNATHSNPDPSLDLADEWDQRINSARSGRDLVTVVRAFVGSWDPMDIAKLPPGARPGDITTPDEIASRAYDLAQARLKAPLPPEIERLVTRMHMFFMNAASRAALLASHRTQP